MPPDLSFVSEPNFYKRFFSLEVMEETEMTPTESVDNAEAEKTEAPVEEAAEPTVEEMDASKEAPEDSTEAEEPESAEAPADKPAEETAEAA